MGYPDAIDIRGLVANEVAYMGLGIEFSLLSTMLEVSFGLNEGIAFAAICL